MVVENVSLVISVLLYRIIERRRGGPAQPDVRSAELELFGDDALSGHADCPESRISSSNASATVASSLPSNRKVTTSAIFATVISMALRILSRPGTGKTV
jgi:hypothetical protein